MPKFLLPQQGEEQEASEGMAGRLMVEYVVHRVSVGELAPSSADVIRVVLRQWINYAGTTVTVWTGDQAARWVFDPGIRASTSKSRLTKLRPFCRWLVGRGDLERDPTAGLARIRVPDGPDRSFDPDEVGDLFHVLPDDRAILIVTLMIQLGLRAGDVARIRVEDIDTRKKLLHVRGKGGRGEPTHWVPITSQAWRTMEPWLFIRSGPLIQSYQRPGHPLTPHTISGLVGDWVRLAGLKQFPGDGRSSHSLRHSFAQHLIDQGTDLRLVQHGMGHKSLRTTENYVRREPMGLREAMEGRVYRRPRDPAPGRLRLVA